MLELREEQCQEFINRVVDMAAAINCKVHIKHLCSYIYCLKRYITFKQWSRICDMFYFAAGQHRHWHWGKSRRVHVQQSDSVIVVVVSTPVNCDVTVRLLVYQMMYPVMFLWLFLSFIMRACFITNIASFSCKHPSLYNYIYVPPSLLSRTGSFTAVNCVI